MLSFKISFLKYFFTKLQVKLRAKLQTRLQVSRRKHYAYGLFSSRLGMYFLLCFCSLLLGSANWALGAADVPDKQAELTVDEASALEKWNPKDTKKGFESEDEEGNYYYEENSDGLAKDISDDVQSDPPKKENYDKGLKSVMSDGSYLFETEESEQSGSFSMRAGSMAAPYIKNSQDVEFTSMYSDKTLNIFFVDYSWEAQLFGKWGLTIGSGIGQSTAPGRFLSDPSQEALEKYTIYVLPNHFSLTYRFQYTKAPYLAPYISGGACAFAFAEKRDDNRKIKGIIARGVQVSGGMKFNLGVIDPQGAFNLDAEYGVNNIWLDVEYKMIKGAQVDRDISANIINAGISFDF